MSRSKRLGGGAHEDLVERHTVPTARVVGAGSSRCSRARAFTRGGHEADLSLLADLCERLPAENDTEYGREARSLLVGTALS
jgi:hypothetical protein